MINNDELQMQKYLGTLRGIKALTFADDLNEVSKVQMVISPYEKGYEVEVMYTLHHEAGTKWLEDRILTSLKKTNVLDNRISGAHVMTTKSMYLDKPACWKLVIHIIIP